MGKCGKGIPLYFLFAELTFVILVCILLDLGWFVWSIYWNSIVFIPCFILEIGGCGITELLNLWSLSLLGPSFCADLLSLKHVNAKTH